MDVPLLVKPDLDYTKALPIHQKRIIAFINHFIMNTVSFLNTFAQSCDSRLMECEFKLNKVDASLRILESQLTSISAENFGQSETKSVVKIEDEVVSPTASTTPEVDEEMKGEVIKIDNSKPSEDPLYSKYFKMVHVGVPAQAVKLKMKNDGLNPNILDQI